MARAVQCAQFRNVYGIRFGSPVMREFYANKRKSDYSLSNTEAITVSSGALTELVAELGPHLAPYRLPESGAVCNGLYHLTGSLASPRLPSVEDYARILVVAAARIGSERAAEFLMEWLEGVPVRVWSCTLLKGVITDGPLGSIDGLHLETLPSSGDQFPRSLFVRIDEHDIRHEQYSHRAMLSIEHDSRPGLYLPSRERDMRVPQLPTIRNPELSSVSPDSLCRSMSIEADNYIDWFMQWWDYRDVDAFFLNAGLSSARRETHDPSPVHMTKEQLVRCLELHKLLDRFRKLDSGIARWIRSRRPLGRYEQLVELRIALESVLLSDDRGIVGEKRHRLGMRGAWLLGESFETRKEHFRTLRDAYDFASSVIHAGRPKAKNKEHLLTVTRAAQDLCRKAILRIVRNGAMPDWSDVVLGKGFGRVPEDSV
ncbi:MAG: hypothetical protein OXI33_17155 [Chloroflexota bacterium]|nr:hypothetical protein [Chloroflexota bacterium]